MQLIKLNLTILFLLVTQAHADTLSSEQVNGVYHLKTPERGKSQLIMQLAQLRGKNVIAVAACQSCPPAIYQFLAEESKTLGVAVFKNSVLYLIRYEDDSFILVQPDGVLGQKVWSKIGYSNVYAKSKAFASSADLAKVKDFALGLSQKIMNQDVGVMAHSDGTYFLAAPSIHLGKPQTSYQVSFNTDAKKTIIIKPCAKCSTDTYNYMPKASAIIGNDVYKLGRNHYLFDLKDGVLISAFSNSSELGNSTWQAHNKFNVYSNSKAFIRQLISSKEKQKTIDNLLRGYFADVKKDTEKQAALAKQKQVAAQNLPQEGMVFNDKKALLAATKRWAKTWNWVETLKRAYLTQNDWTIIHNKLTGVITGRVIAGVVTMKHPDGRCRYQNLVFKQDYNGSGYSHLHVSGISTIYDLKCSKI